MIRRWLIRKEMRKLEEQRLTESKRGRMLEFKNF